MNGKITYCVARGAGEPIYQKGRDLDLIINKEDISQFDKFVSEIYQWHLINKIKRHYVVTYFFYSTRAKVFFQIDCEFDFDWWSFKILSSRSILQQRYFCDLQGIYYACDLHANTMKLYRTLLWGQRLKNKYLEELLTAEANSSICTDKPLLSSLELRSLLSNPDSDYVKLAASRIRRGVLVHNLKEFGYLQVIARFFKFFYNEMNILFKNNGLELEIKSHPKADNLIKYLQFAANEFRSPFKSVILLSKPSSLLARLKRNRDATLTLHVSPTNRVTKCIISEDGSLKLYNPNSKNTRLFANYEDLWFYLAFSRAI